MKGHTKVKAIVIRKYETLVEVPYGMDIGECVTSLWKCGDLTQQDNITEDYVDDILDVED